MYTERQNKKLERCRALGDDSIYREIALLKKLDHPNIVKMYEVINDPVSEHIYLILELVSGGKLGNSGGDGKSDPVPVGIAFRWFRDIVAGVSYLHDQLVVHRDLKLENCLLTADGRVKLCDFGFSHVFRENEDGMLRRKIGTPSYEAPEILSLLKRRE